MVKSRPIGISINVRKFRISMIPLDVAFDESGNTGQNLFDTEAPIFTIGSIRLELEAAREAASAFNGLRAEELKFSKLRRRSSGRRAIQAFLERKEICSQNVQVYAVSKPFMVVTKFCDHFVEPSFRRMTGRNFYEADRQVATANLLHHLMPTFLGSVWTSFLASFVAFVRHREDRTLWVDFRDKAELIYNSLGTSEPRLAAYFGLVLESEARRDALAEAISDDELDPLFTCYVALADSWGQRLNQRFRVLADESRVLSARAELFRKLSDPRLKRTVTGEGERTTVFPLLVEDIVTVDSKSDVRVQLADIIAGAAVAALGERSSDTDKEEAEFPDRLQSLMCDKQLFSGGVWPYRSLDQMFRDLQSRPKASNSISAPDHIARVLSRQNDA
jgi:hypothetical protein